MSAKMIEIESLSVQFPDAEEDDYALSNVSTKLEQGDFICVLGKSGAGKSTLIRCLNGLQAYTDGSVKWDGKELGELREKELREIRREMGMIFQHFHLIPRLTVLQNVMMGLFGYGSSFKHLLGWYSQFEKEKVYKVIEDVELTPEMHRRVERLSGGQKQRVGIARALLQEPCMFLGDEPVSSLDPGTADRIFRLLQHIHEKHSLLTVINVHNVEIAKRYATRILALRDGRLVYDGKADDFNEKEFSFIYE